jgi:dihydrofolate reductase
MTTGHVFIAVSLDGFIARRDGDIDWLENQGGENEDNGFAEMMASVDGLIMGRATFQKVLSFGEWVYEKPVIVMSRSLTQSDVPDHLRGRVRLSNSTPKALMGELSAEGWARAYVDGGKVIQSFLS